jgi:beta-lactam-binding protein with PASTA domain
MQPGIRSRLLISMVFFCILNTIGAQEYIPVLPSKTAQATVPKVTGMNQADAEDALQKAGLKVARIIERQTRLPDGRVFRQKPGPDTKVAKGSGVVLLVSKKGAPAMQQRETLPEPAVVPAMPATPSLSEKKTLPQKTEANLPSITGKTFSEAFQEVRKLGFTIIQPQKVKSTEPRETVIGVMANGEEATDSAYPLDTPIVLLVSTGPEGAAPVRTAEQPKSAEGKKRPQPGPVTIVDPFFSLNAKQMGGYFKATGHDVQYQVLAGSQPKGTIIGIVMDGRNLKAGDQVPEAKGVTLQVSGGPDYKSPAGSNGMVQTKMPEVKDAKITDLAPKLKANGQKVSVQEVPSSEDPGTVTGAKTGNQNLKGGENIPVGGQVDVQVSGGPGFQMPSQATVSGKPPLIVEFKTDPATMIYGGQIHLIWNTADARRVKIEKRERDDSGKISKQTVYDQPIPQPTDIGIAGITGQPGTASCTISKTTVFTLTASNDAGTVNQCATVTFQERPQPPQILFFSAGTGHPDVPVQPNLKQNTKQQIQTFPKGPLPGLLYAPPQGDTAYTETLSWQIVNLGEGGKAFIRPNVGEVPETGSVTVPVTGEMVYILTAQNSSGIDTATVRVRPAKPQIRYFGARPNPLAHVGDAVRIGWSIVHADQILLSPEGIRVESEGTLEKQLIEPTTYKLTAQNPGGVTQQEITVGIADYRKGIYRFEATPDSIPVGGSTTLHFILLGLGPNPRISIQSTPSLSAVTDWSRELQLKPANNMEESRSFALQSNTTFNLSILTADGTAYEKSITVEAGMTPDIAFFGLDKHQQVSGGFVEADLRWTVHNATRVTIEPDIGDVPFEGTKGITLNTPVLYRLTAYGNPSGIVVRDTLWTGEPADMNAQADIYEFYASPPIASETSNSVRITWSGQGVTASLKKFYGRNFVRKWDDLKINDNILDTVNDNAVYSLTLSSLSDTETKLLEVDYQSMPTLQAVCKRPTIRSGQADTLIWSAGNLDGTGTLIFQGGEALPVLGQKIVTPTQTTTYTFEARNEAGVVNKQVTVVVLPPAPYVTVLDMVASPVIRENNYALRLEVAYADSVRFTEIRPDGSRHVMDSRATDSNRIVNFTMSHIVLADFPISEPVSVTVEILVFQGCESYPMIRELTVLPYVDLQVNASFSQDNGPVWTFDDAYDVTISVVVANMGKDTWYASNIGNGKKAQIKVEFPSVLSNSYNILYEAFNPNAVTWIKMEIPAHAIIHPNQTEIISPQHLALPVLYSGTYTVTSTVDPDNLVTEWLENNNDTRDEFEAETIDDYYCYPIPDGHGGSVDGCIDGSKLIFHNTQ